MWSIIFNIVVGYLVFIFVFLGLAYAIKILDDKTEKDFRWMMLIVAYPLLVLLVLPLRFISWVSVKIIAPLFTVVVVAMSFVVLSFLFNFILGRFGIDGTPISYLAMSFSAYIMAYQGRKILELVYWIMNKAIRNKWMEYTSSKVMEETTKNNFRRAIYWVLLIITSVFFTLNFNNFVILVNGNTIDLKSVEWLVEILEASMQALVTFVVLDNILQIKTKEE